MPGSGSSQALVLSTSSRGTDEEVPPGPRAAQLLSSFLDPEEFKAVAVVHGLGRSAPRAFDLAKQAIADGDGVVWVTDPDLLTELTGDEAARMRAAFAPEEGKLMTFHAPRTRRTNWSLHWSKVTASAIDRGLLEAGRDQ